MKSSLIFSIIVLFGVFIFIYMHEQVHAEIYSYYGADSHTEYFSYFPNVVTISEEGCPTKECALAQNFNEVVSYPLLAFYFLISFGLFFLIREVEK